MRSVNRRHFLHYVSTGVLGAALTKTTASASVQRRPNVLFIITDDQGYGDLGCHGNPVLKTPNLDKLHGESVRLTQFHVCPVCSPTRACLMTGRYNYRTGVVDTYAGRSMTHPEETTLAELFKAGGYHTGIFGKWHLGDTWPLRPMDRGFDASLVHRGGGIAQPSDPEFYERDDTYFNPMLQHNGKQERFTGYCTDIFTDAALSFMKARQGKPFFTYLAFNAPHTPLQVPEEYAAPYKALGLQEETALVYGMIANTDHNIGRVLQFLKASGLDANTIVLFMTDNGAQKLRGDDRYNAGLRGWKGSVYEGGIRVPCFIRWPKALPAGRDLDRIAAHIDLAPTLLDLCGVSPSNTPAFDGVSLTPLLADTENTDAWPDRNLFFQWHRGDAPEPFKNSAVRNQQWKLVNGNELYDMAKDPLEQQDTAQVNTEVVQQLRQAYLRWFEDVSSTRGYDPVRIHLGGKYENPVTLTRQDWRNAPNWTDKNAVGYWEVQVEASGAYKAVVTFDTPGEEGALYLRLGEQETRQHVAPDASSATVDTLQWVPGKYRLECYLETGDQKTGPQFIHVFKK